MKDINARTTLKLGLCFYLFLGFVPTQAAAGEYYIYRDSNGGLVISNKQPPRGSKILRQQTLPDVADSQSSSGQERDDIRSNGQIEGSPNASKNK